MKTTKNTEGLGIKTGIAISILLIAYFLLMKQLNLVHIIELRFLNFFIFLGGIMYAYKSYQKPNQDMDYLPGMVLGLTTTAATVVPFAAFIFVYFSYINPNLIQVLKDNSVSRIKDHVYLTE